MTIDGHPENTGRDALAVFALAFVLQIIFMARVVDLYDEGIILVGAEQAANGKVIHRDFYANYGPGQFYVLAGLFKLLTPSVLVGRLWDTAIRSSAAALVYLVAAAAASRRAAWFTALASGLWLASFGTYGYPVFPALVASLAAFLCLAPWRNGTPPPPFRLSLAGIAAGVAALFRYDFGLFTVAAELTALALYAVYVRQAALELLRSMGLFAAGWLLVILPLLIAYALSGVIGDFLFDVVQFPGRSYAATRSLPFPNAGELWSDPWSLGIYLPLIACAAALPALVGLAITRGKAPPIGDRRDFWFVAGLMSNAFFFFLKGVVRPHPVHMSASIIVALILLAVLITRLPAGRGARAAVGLALVAATWSTGGALREILFRAIANARWVASGEAWSGPSMGAQAETGSCRAPPGLERSACFLVDEDRLAAIRYVQERTKPGEPLYVGLTRHDRIVVNDTTFYFLAKRPPATKWSHFDPGLQTSAPIQHEMVDELAASPPRFVILESQWDRVQEPNASAQSSGVMILDAYIHDHYR